VRGRPIAAVGSAYSNAYNGLIQQRLATYAAQGVTVNYLDINRVGDVVEANLSAFGLQSAGACPVACATDSVLAERFLFYLDQVHLTQRGFEIVGQYAVRQIEAPLTFGAQTDIGVSTAAGFGQFMAGRLDWRARIRSGRCPFSSRRTIRAMTCATARRAWPMIMTASAARPAWNMGSAGACSA
jgi:phospholipase/lecithinase/hemolysin